VNKDASIVVNDKMYNDVVIVSSCNYSKLEGQDRFDCELAGYSYYAKNVGLVHYSFKPPFQGTLIDLINYQIEH